MPASQVLERIGRDDEVDERHQRHEYQQHGNDVEQQLRAVDRAARERIHAAGVLGRELELTTRRLAFGRHHDEGHGQRPGHRHDPCDGEGDERREHDGLRLLGEFLRGVLSVLREDF